MITPVLVVVAIAVVVAAVVGATAAWRTVREINELKHLSQRWLEPVDLAAVWRDDDPGL